MTIRKTSFSKLLSLQERCSYNQFLSQEELIKFDREFLLIGKTIDKLYHLLLV
ncbi:hypothetical protein NIES4106_19900 [Fischerella sp. NIES-4106]|nr:hypothetical protein NIES4106_19900 [Fischerella sp. NIES-4106]